MADFTHLNRLEVRPRDNAFTHTLAAPVRDPLWFLARQWQIGEFNAEDSGSVAYVQYSTHTAPMPRWLRKRASEPPGDPPAVLPLDQGAPLESQTLQEPFTPDLSGLLAR
jgi:hypothetical protein